MAVHITVPGSDDVSRGPRSYARVIAVVMIVGAFIFSALPLTNEFLFGGVVGQTNAETSEVPAKTSYEVSSSYFNDDGNPSTYVQSSKLQKRSFVKCFPSVTIPTDSDLVIYFWYSSASTGTLGYDVRVGNADAGYNITSNLNRDNYTMDAGALSTSSWRYLRISDIDTKLETGKVAVNISTNQDYCPNQISLGIDAIANTGSYQSWYFDGSVWTAWTATNTFFIRLYFVEQETIDSDHSLSQLQLSSEIEGSSKFYSDETANMFDELDAIDGLSSWSSTGYGWCPANQTDDQWLNITFMDMTVISIGDSIIAGHPYHDPNPTVYDQSDNRQNCMQWELSNLLGVHVINRGVGSQTTTQIAARFTTDVLDYKPNFVIIEGGINDIVLGATVDTITTNLGSMYEAATVAGVTVIAWTILPDGAISAINKAKVNQTNNWIRNQSSTDVIVVDAYEALVDPSNPGALLAAYDCGDHVHPSVAGYELLGEITFEDGFDSTPADVTAYSLDKITIESPCTGSSLVARPKSMNVSYNGGYLLVAVTNSTTQTIDFGQVATSWVNLTFSDCWRNAIGVSYVGIGEVRVYGLPASWAPNSIYRFGWHYYALDSSLIEKLPYPRTLSPLLAATPSNGFINISVDEYSESALAWTASVFTSGTSVFYVVYKLSSDSGYKVYLDGNVIATGTGPTLSFTATGGGEFEVVVWYPKTVSSMVLLTVNMVGLGILVSVIAGWVIPFSRAIKAGRYTNTNQMMKELMRGFIFIVVALIMWTMLHNVAIG